MTERSRFWTTNNTGDGPAIGYSTSDWEKIIRHWFQGGDENNGSVLLGVGNNLAVTGATSPVAINTGAAIVYGHYYENDASLNLAIATPVVGTTGFIVGLRVSNAAQTVRAFATRNTDGLSAAPSPTQTPGTTFEIVLYTGTITTGGAITLTDARKYAKFSTRVYGSMLDPAIVDSSTIEINSNIIRVKDSGIVTAKIADANVTTAKLANDSVDDTKAGNRVPQFYRRQGGNATDWITAGTTTQTPTSVRMQAGVLAIANTDGATGKIGSTTLTFPTAFSAKPLVFAQVYNDDDTIATVSNVTATQCTISWRGVESSVAFSMNVQWFAVGPE